MKKILKVSQRIAAVSMAVILMMPVNVFADTQLSANSKTVNRGQNEVEELYQNSVKSYDTSGMFQTTPVLTKGSYNPGTLSQDAVDKTVHQINYFRELAGLNHNITAYTEKMEQGQYGATGMEIVNKLTHEFTDEQKATLLSGYMTSDELDKAAAGIGVGISDSKYTLWNGNCSSTNNAVEAIQRYVDDTANVNSGTGHRFNMLSLMAQAATFGASKNEFSCTSIYGIDFEPNKEAYYAWPCEGYFPVKAMNTTMLWSLECNQGYKFVNSSSPKDGITATCIYKDKEYSCTVIQADYRDNAKCPCIAFQLPEELQNIIAENSSAYNNAKTADIKVKVSGLKNASGNAVYAEYTTKLYRDIPVAMTGITINKTTETIHKGETTKLSINCQPENTTDSKDVTWTSGNEKIATVDADGAVTAQAPGTATITAKVGSFSAKCAITVDAPLKSISLNKNQTTIEKGKSETLNVNYNPIDTTDSRDVTWSSDNESVATVDENGKVTAIGKGAATITATVGKKTAACTVEVSVPLTGISMNKEETTIHAGESETLNITYDPKDTTDDKTVTWTSSNEKIATVDADGAVTAHAPGTATITAKVGSFSAKCSITVDAPLKSISLDKNSILLEKGENETLHISYQPSNTTDSTDVTWSSDNENVATVDENGTVTAINEGAATITATVEDKTVTCRVQVKKQLKESMISAIPAQIYTGEDKTPEITVKDGDNQLEKDVDYRVSYSNHTNAGIAKVIVTGMGDYAGTATKEFIIEAKELTYSEVGSIADQTYTGNYITPAVFVRDAGRTLKAGTDYMVFYSNNKNPGTSTVTITGCGNYRGTKTTTFRIGKLNGAVTSRNITKDLWDKPFRVPVSVLGDGTPEYRINNSKIAQTTTNGTVTILGAGVTNITITLPETDIYTGASKTITLKVNGHKGTVSKLTSGKKKLTVSWKKDEKSGGYEVLLATNSKFTKGKKLVKVNGNKTTKKTITKLKKGKKYYVKVRGFKVVNGRKIYGAYGSVKKSKKIK